MSNRRTRANSAPLNARVTLELANRLRQHLADHGCGNLSDFVSAAIEEKLAREALYTKAAQSPDSQPAPEAIHRSAPGPATSVLSKRRFRFAKKGAAGQLACNWQDRKAGPGALSME